jgi:hypothetical protein
VDIDSRLQVYGKRGIQGSCTGVAPLHPGS